MKSEGVEQTRAEIFSETGGVVENTVLSILAIVALGLLIAVSGGIIYLTAVEWRERRQQQKEKRNR